MIQLAILKNQVQLNTLLSDGIEKATYKTVIWMNLIGFIHVC